MRATTVRRLVVLGVCSLGVAALYLAPSVARSPHQVTRQPVSGVPGRSGTDTVSYAPGRVSPGPTRAAPAGAPVGQPPVRTEGRATPSGTPRPGATARPPGQARDDEPPGPVAGLVPVEVRPDRLTVRWAAAQDDVGVTGYRLWLNGFTVADTAGQVATLRWFNDGSRTQVIQVRARDAAGNLSEDAATILVERPTTSPAPTTSPTPSASPAPTPGGRSEPGDPTPEVTPSSPSESASATPGGTG